MDNKRDKGKSISIILFCIWLEIYTKRGGEMNLSEIILEKIKKHHRGKENAIKRKDLLVFIHLYEITALTDRELRNVYCQLPVISSEAGIFWPIRQLELDEFEEYCRKKALPLFIRVKMVMEEHKDLRAEKYIQKELF